MDRYHYVNKVAKVLGCSRPMMYKLVYEGKMKAIRIGKRGIRISGASLNDFIAENTVEPVDIYSGDKIKETGGRR